jgi:cell division protein FtsZ
MHTSNGNHATPEASPIKTSFTIKVLGVGGAGCNALGHMSAEPLEGVAYAALNTDAAVLGRLGVSTRLVLGTKSTRGLGAGGDPERGRAAAEEDRDQIRALCDGADIVFIVAGLGGGTGTGAAPVVACTAREMGALVLAIVFLPFDCEGGRRQAVALEGLEQLQSEADGVICLPNQKLFKFIDEKTTLIDAFAVANNFVASGIRGIWRLLFRPGFINIDFSDLCSLTKGKHSDNPLATVEARGEHRAQEVLDKLFAHPLIDGGQVLADATGVLITIAGGPNLTMTEVNRISEQIQRQAENAQIFLGAAIEEELEDRITVTVVASCRSNRRAEAQPERGRKSEPADLGRANRPGEPAGHRFQQRVDPDSQLIESNEAPRPASRFVPPPPELTPDRTEQLLVRQNGNGSRQRKVAARLRQGQLPLEIISRGRFEKSEPTIHRGEDLDVPTYIRRNIALN